MGINGVWEYIGTGEVTAIADLAAQSLIKKGRPLRIAVDEAHWRFKNPNGDQVEDIRQRTHRASNPVEKNMLHRLLPLLCLDIHLLFIFDGPRRPEKRGRIPAVEQPATVALFKELLAGLRIPYHVAPAEAEAECARLGTLGLVDAAWSEDSDILMFGCPLLFTNVIDAKGQKSKTHVRVHDIAKVSASTGIDRDGLVTFAILAGCDYTKGLSSCGPVRALKAAKQDFRRIICCATTPRDLARWRDAARDYFQKETDCRNVILSDRFPDKNVMDLCINPVVSSREIIADLSGQWEACWKDRINEPQLRNLLGARPKNTSYDIKPIKAIKGGVTSTTTRMRLEPHESVATVRGMDIGKVDFVTLTSIAQLALPELANSSRNEKTRASTSKRKRRDSDQTPASDGALPAKRRGRPPGARNKTKLLSSGDQSSAKRNASSLQAPKISTSIQPPRPSTCHTSVRTVPHDVLVCEDIMFNVPEDDLPSFEDIFGRRKRAPTKSTALSPVSGNPQRNGGAEKATAHGVKTHLVLPGHMVEAETIDLTGD